MSRKRYDLRKEKDLIEVSKLLEDESDEEISFGSRSKGEWTSQNAPIHDATDMPGTSGIQSYTLDEELSDYSCDSDQDPEYVPDVPRRDYTNAKTAESEEILFNNTGPPSRGKIKILSNILIREGTSANEVEHEALVFSPVQCQVEDDTSKKEGNGISIAEETRISECIGETSTSETVASKELTRWKIPRPECWKKNIAKQNRSKCEPYTTKNIERPAKRPKEIDCSKCIYKCQDNFTPEDRVDLCKTYWSFDYKRQRDFILTFVKSHNPTRRITGGINKRYSSRTYCFLKNDELVRVCKLFFEKTLCISNGPVITAFKGRNESGIFVNDDLRGKKTPSNKRSDEEISIMRQQIESFPKMESHYVRKTSKRQYLDKNLNITKMYELYREYCKEKTVAPISQTCYRKYFCTNYNLSFYHPKKDQCSTCCNYESCKSPEEKIALEPVYQAHQARKTDCYDAKELDKDRAKADSTFVTCSFDLQSVLQIPKSDVSQFYYSRKICVYNLTIYEGANAKGHCYCWNELHGKRGSSEVGTALLKWLENLPQEVKEVSLFSDTCGGQNRNKNIAALFLFGVQKLKNINVIEHKFLESGHSFMECDSMHSAIETESKNKTVYGMSGWLEIFKNARSKRTRTPNEAYHVHELRYNDFINLQLLSNKIIKNRLKDENGTIMKWLKIKSMRYDKKLPGVIQYRYDHHSPYQNINVYGRAPISIPSVIDKAYNKVLPISVQKKKDLWQLCTSKLIPEEYHGWYAQLPTTQNSTQNDSVPEPNLSDELESE